MEADSDDLAVKKALHHRSFVLKEVLESEQEYVRRLQIAYEDYQQYISVGSDDIPPQLKTDSLAIFSTLPQIVAFHRDVFLPAIESCRDDTAALVQCFVTHSDKFNVYLPYCKNKPSSDSVRLEHDAWFHARQEAIGQRLGIEDLLITPVQRFTKYQLLIRDLLKDTKKAKEDTTSIERALELMKRIPKETNNIICMSLLRGISRASILGHGTLWIQETLLFWDEKSVRGETRQVYLFDHRIIVALPADREGFFDFQLSIKTLSGTVLQTVEGDPLKFAFTTSDKELYHFQATSPESKVSWISALDSILNSQSKMMRALMFGKSASPRGVSRIASVPVDWSGSDSSVDSLPSSDSEKEDWPATRGFLPLRPSQRKRQQPSQLNPAIRPREGGRNRSVTLNIPHSSSFPAMDESDRSSRSRHLSATLNPRKLTRLFSRRSSSRRQESSSVAYPLPSASPTHSIRRSPGAIPKVPKVVSNGNGEDVQVYIGKEGHPPVADPLHDITPGQVCVPVDRSQPEAWKVRLCSGENSGTTVWVQSNCIESYTAPISSDHMYKIKKKLGRGRFSKVRLGKHRTTHSYNVLKVVRPDVTIESFHRELCIGWRLQHKNLVQYYGGVEGSERIIVMQHGPGRLLLDYLIWKSSVTETAISKLMKQLLDGLEYLHSHTLMHLDIRPENIMVIISREEDVLKLFDYGAMRHTWAQGGVTPLHQNYEPACDYQYTPPEVFQQESLEPRSDIWSAGVITFLLFYGQTPFQGGSPVRTIANITGASYSFPSESACSHQAREFMKAVLVVQPRDRPSAKDAEQLEWFSDCQQFSDTLINLAQLKLFIQSC